MNGPELIRKYILEKKGVDIGGIATPRDATEWIMFHHAVQVAARYFAAKGTN